MNKIQLSMELCSEYPYFKDNYKSDIYFSLNNKRIACWTSPGNFGDRRGKYNPAWWNMGSEYGKKVSVSIKEDGTYIDKVKVSNSGIKNIEIEEGTDLKFRITCPHDTEYPGGINIFGKGFGDFNQDIEVRIEYE
jgi:predicted transcriptional regulator